MKRDSPDQGTTTFRAVKEIVITHKHVRMNDYLHELEGILKFSHDKVLPLAGRNPSREWRALMTNNVAVQINYL